MKKVLTLIVMAVAIAMPSNAQAQFGLKGGLNLTNISDFSFSAAGVDNAIKSKAGFFVGPTVKFTLPVVGLGIDASALYDQREGKVESDGGESMTLKSQSIQILSLSPSRFPSMYAMALVWAKPPASLFLPVLSLVLTWVTRIKHGQTTKTMLANGLSRVLPSVPMLVWVQCC